MNGKIITIIGAVIAAVTGGAFFLIRLKKKQSINY